MALFFDAAWFDARLRERSLSRPVLAAAAGLSAEDLDLLFKDQRELSAGEVAVFADQHILIGFSVEDEQLDRWLWAFVDAAESLLISAYRVVPSTVDALVVPSAQELDRWLQSD